MAFIAPLAGAAVGGGLLGSIVTTAVGIGINLAISYFFPQKIKGPRAESLKAQTSQYGDQLARWHGSIRTAGAVIWLKGNHVDEHVKTERQGKALGPEVTTYSYTATFAVAFAWNGPASGVLRIWADDKLIFDVSAEALQAAIDHGSRAIGVAKGASIRVYLGTDTQEPDPDIEADRGAGMVPAWPGIVYVVVKNLPLDEFGIRVPNIEAEITKSSIDSYISKALSPAVQIGSQCAIDTRGNYAVARNRIWDIPSGATRTFDWSSSNYFRSVLIDGRNNIIKSDGFVFKIFDAATGALLQTLDRPTTYSTLAYFGSPSDDVSIAGVTYILEGAQFDLSIVFTMVSAGTVGSLYQVDWSAVSAYASDVSYGISVGPQYGYMVATSHTDIIRVAMAGAGLVETSITPSGLTAHIAGCYYDDDSDSVVIVTVNGDVFVYTADLSTLLRSSTGHSLTVNVDSSYARRMKSAADQIMVQSGTTTSGAGATWWFYRISDLQLLDSYQPHAVGYVNNGYYSEVALNPDAGMAFGIHSTASGSFFFLKRAGREPVPLADVLEEECRFAGLTADASAVPTMIYGIGDRAGTPPRGVIEDLTRVNFVDWAQIDGVQTFFPSQTASFRNITMDEIGMALNAEPDTVQISEEYPSALDMPEQVIITYPSYDAVYRIGAQAGNTKEDQKFNDEPSQADETGAPIKVRRKRALQFSTAQVLTDTDAARVADVMHNSLIDAATVYKTTVGPKHMDLHPGQVVTLPLDETRTAKAVLTKMSGDTVIEMEFRKRGDSFTSEAIGQPTPYVIDTLLGPADVAPALIDGHMLRSADNNDGFYAGVAVVSTGNFRSATLFRSEDGGSVYNPWAGFTNGMIRGIATTALPDRPHPGAIDRASSFVIAVPVGTPPDSISEAALLASETSNGFAVYNSALGDWEYIRAASVVDNGNDTWTLSTLLRGCKGTEFAMPGHIVGDIVFHLDDQAMIRATDGDRTLSRIYVAVATSTVFDSTGAVTFTNQGKGLRPWAPQLVSAVLDAGTGDWTFTFNRRDRLGQAWPESGAETPPMSEDSEAYAIKFYDGMGAVVGTYSSVVESYVYSAADQTTDFGSPQTTMPTIGLAQVSAIYGNGVELREAA